MNDVQILQQGLKNLFDRERMTKDKFNDLFFTTAAKMELNVGAKYNNGEAFLKFVNGELKGTRKTPSEITNGIIVTDYLSKEEEKRVEFKIEIATGSYKKRKSQYLFFQKFREELKKRFDSQKLKETIPFLANRCKVHPEDIPKLAVAFPPVLFCIADSNSYSDDYVSDLLFISDTERYNPNTKKASDYKLNKKMSEFEGLLLGHAISPFSEQLNLLLELGRYKRIEKIFELEAKIIITKPDWGELNFAAKKLKKTGFDIKRNLESGFNYRKILYAKMGFESKNVEELDKNQSLSKHLIRNKEQNETESDYTKYLNKEKLKFEEGIKWYSEFANIVRTNFEVDEITKDNFRELTKKINELTGENSEESRKNLKGELALLRHPNPTLEKQLRVINSILESFKTIEKDTFEYVFLQRNAQHNYNNHLKIGVESENMFDKPYTILDKLDEIQKHELSVLYIHQYFYGKEDENHSIPYYFPSGNIAEKFPEIEVAEQEVIFVFDHKTPARVEKVRKIVFDMTLSSIAIQMSDLFSFMNSFFKDNNQFWKEFLPTCEKFDKELFDVWNLYLKDEDVELKNFTNNVLSIGYDIGQMPYFFFPYLMALRISVEKDNNLETHFRTFFYDTIIFVLKSLDEEMNLDEWKFKFPTKK